MRTCPAAASRTWARLADAAAGARAEAEDEAAKLPLLEHAAAKLRQRVLAGATDADVLELIRPLAEPSGVGDLRQAYEAILKAEQARSAELRRLKHEGELASRAEVDAVHEAKAGMLRQDLLAMDQLAGEMVFLVEGDPARVEELRAYLRERLEEALHRYASRQEFEVVFQGGEG